MRRLVPAVLLCNRCSLYSLLASPGCLGYVLQAALSPLQELLEPALPLLRPQQLAKLISDDQDRSKPIATQACGLQPKFNSLKERQIQLALQALEKDAKLSVRRAAAIYSTSETTLRARRAGRPSRVDTMANSRNLTNNEEQVIVTYILELVARGEPPPSSRL